MSGILGVLSRMGALAPASISRLVTPQGLSASGTAGVLQQVRTFKDVDVLAKRCKDCYFHKDDYRWYVLCQTHPRHKQRQRVHDVRNFWIVTHRTHGPRKKF